MADAEDLKSSGDFSSCGFDSHPGHHFYSMLIGLSPCCFLHVLEIDEGKSIVAFAATSAPPSSKSPVGIMDSIPYPSPVNIYSS
jgi:hypothetical protein